MQPAHSRGHGRKHKPDNEVADGKYGCPHFGEGNLVDVSFQYRSGESSHDVKEEQAYQTNVRYVESDRNIPAHDKK